MAETGPRGRLTLQTIAMPADTNSAGDIFGGWLMSQIDLGCSVLARERAQGRVTTVAVESMTFLRPVHVGDVVSIHTEIRREGTTSMAIGVDAWVSRMPAGARLRVAEAVFVFVAVDAVGVKRPLPERE